MVELPAYDMIIGMDWLARFSPMNVHWDRKWMAIPYEGSTTMLYGDLDQLPEGSTILLSSVQELAEHPAAAKIPDAVQHILDEFAAVFAVPSSLPPPRSNDHSIPLIDGASLVNIHPYRVAPALKDEIERQIQDMLTSGIIKIKCRSILLFSSSG